MDAKVEFIAARNQGEENMTALCRRLGISRQCGYELWRRYQAEGNAAFEPRSRAPKVVPWAISEAQAQAIVELRDKYPSWGPKKLRAKLCQSAPEQQWPARSTIGDLLKREGRIKPRSRRR